jgi:hypothetical protein
VQEGPDELAADVFQPEFEMGVLVNGVVAAVERGGADVQALLVRNFFGADQARCVTRARGGDGGIERMREVVAESDARQGGFNEFAGARAIEHARLSGHVGLSFYTGGGKRKVLSQESKKKEKDSAETQSGQRSAEKRVTAGCTHNGNGRGEPRPYAFLKKLFLGGVGFDLGVGVLLGETFDAAGGVDQLLLAGEEGMAIGADFDAQHVALNGRASLERVAAGAVHRNGMIVGVDTGFHGATFRRVRSARLPDKVRAQQPRR